MKFKSSRGFLISFLLVMLSVIIYLFIQSSKKNIANDRGRILDAISVTTSLLEDYINDSNGGWPTNWDDIKLNQKKRAKRFSSAFGYFELPSDIWKIEHLIDIDFSFLPRKDEINTV